VSEILEAVRARGEAALAEYCARFDGAVPAQYRLSSKDLRLAASLVSQDLRVAIDQAIANISTFHKAQRIVEPAIETMPGISCLRRAVPIERVGIYIPAGTAPLFSTLIMLGVPATLAGCREVVLVSPGGANAQINPAIALCAERLGIEEVYLLGGAQAIAALAYGTESIQPVCKIFGPGNAYVTEAKLQVAAQGIAIDLPAGPSEVLVIADECARPAWIAADLLAQAEHGPDSQVVLVTTSEQVLADVLQELAQQLAKLPREDTARLALTESRFILVRDLAQATQFSNLYAPEHLILSVQDPEALIERISNAGSVFLGEWTPEALGDYASGTNHVLPTNGAARSYSGVSLDSFVKKITFQRATREGLMRIAPCVSTMARAEGLDAHARAVEIRQEELV
jgi:histidinol dehydrogenase